MSVSQAIESAKSLMWYSGSSQEAMFVVSLANRREWGVAVLDYDRLQNCRLMYGHYVTMHAAIMPGENRGESIVCK